MATDSLPGITAIRCPDHVRVDFDDAGVATVTTEDCPTCTELRADLRAAHDEIDRLRRVKEPALTQDQLDGLVAWAATHIAAGRS